MGDELFEASSIDSAKAPCMEAMGCVGICNSFMVSASPSNDEMLDLLSGSMRVGGELWLSPEEGYTSVAREVMAPRTASGVRTTSMILTASPAGEHADGSLLSYCTLPDGTQSQQ